MYRRTFLRGAAIAAPPAAGCLSTPPTDGPDRESKRVSIVGRDPELDLPVRPSVEVVEPRASDDAPPRLRTRVTNEADYRVEVGEERAIVFAFVHSEGSPGAILLPEPADQYSAVEPGCWRLSDPVAVPEYYGVTVLEPGASAERELGVWGATDGSGCLPTGRFRFATTYDVGRDRTDGIDDPDARGQWGFTLRIE